MAGIFAGIIGRGIVFTIAFSVEDFCMRHRLLGIWPLLQFLPCLDGTDASQVCTLALSLLLGYTRQCRARSMGPFSVEAQVNLFMVKTILINVLWGSQVSDGEKHSTIHDPEQVRIIYHVSFLANESQFGQRRLCRSLHLLMSAVALLHSSHTLSSLMFLSATGPRDQLWICHIDCAQPG